MFIRSSTAINDCLIALDIIALIKKAKLPLMEFSNGFPNCSPKSQFSIEIVLKSELRQVPQEQHLRYVYLTEEVRDKAYDELCEFLNCNYKLRDFT